MNRRKALTALAAAGSRCKAASELIRRGQRYQLAVRRLHGLPVFDVPEHFPVITSERVRELLHQGWVVS